MKHAAWMLLLVLSACNENLAHTPPPMDQFFFPGGLALTRPVAGGNQALLVVSSNSDLHYDKQVGATLLSIAPEVYDPASGRGSTGTPGGDLQKYGPGAQLGSFAGPVAVADAQSCASLTTGLATGGAPLSAPMAFVASRYTRLLYRFPLGDDGSVGPCTGRSCQIGTDQDLLDPAAVGIACRDQAPWRRSLFLGYMRSPPLGAFTAGTGWISEYDLADLGKPPRTISLAPGPVGGMAYDAQTDRIYAVGRFAGLTAPLFVVNLQSCTFTEPSASAPNDCPAPHVQTVDLYSAVRGAELVDIALSNPQPGRPRLAYVSARIFDESYAMSIQSRPSFDVGGALIVVELDEGVAGSPVGRIRQVVPIGIGAGSVKALPVRPGLGDLVVVTSAVDGSVHLFDDEVREVIRVITIDASTGAPEAGHYPVAMAVEDRGTEALVYIGAFSDWTLSVLRVPLADPASADLLRAPAPPGSLEPGKPLRIGRTKP